VEIRARVNKVFQNYGKYMVDVLTLPAIGKNALLDSIQIEGSQYIDEALAEGHGVILVTGHIGNWDYAGAVLAALNYRISVVTDTLAPPQWNARVQHTRERLGMNPIPMDSGIRDMVQVLRRNEVLGILIDKPLDDGGARVHFLESPTRVPAGAATLAIRTGAPIAPAVIVRDGDRYRAHVGRLIRPCDTSDRSTEVETVTQRIMSQLEVWIRQYPEQWFMFRNMWPGVN